MVMLVKLKNLEKFMTRVFGVINTYQEGLPFIVQFKFKRLTCENSNLNKRLIGQSFMNQVVIDTDAMEKFFTEYPESFLINEDLEYYLTDIAVHAVIFNIMHEVSHTGQETHCGVIRGNKTATRKYVESFEMANDRNTMTLLEKYIPHFNQEFGSNLDLNTFKRCAFYLQHGKGKDMKYIPCTTWKNMIKRTISSMFELDLLHTNSEPIVEINESNSGMNYLVDFRNTDDNYFHEASLDLAKRLFVGKLLEIVRLTIDPETCKITIALESIDNPKTFVSDVVYCKSAKYKKALEVGCFSSYPNTTVYEEQYNM